MDVSDRDVPGGQELIETVVTLTGLPENWVQQELTKIVEDSGHSADELTLPQLRAAMLAYLHAMQEDFTDGEMPAECETTEE